MSSANYAAAKNLERVGSTLEILVDGPSEEDPRWLEGRHEGLAPEIDGVVYINASKESKAILHPGDCVNVRITDAATYDLTGHVVGDTSGPTVRNAGDGLRGGYR